MVEEDYQATQEGISHSLTPSTEIIGYAKYLGIDVEKEQDLLWIAMEGVKAIFVSYIDS